VIAELTDFTELLKKFKFLEEIHEKKRIPAHHIQPPFIK